MAHSDSQERLYTLFCFVVKARGRRGCTTPSLQTQTLNCSSWRGGAVRYCYPVLAPSLAESSSGRGPGTQASVF